MVSASPFFASYNFTVQSVLSYGTCIIIKLTFYSLIHKETIIQLLVCQYSAFDSNEQKLDVHSKFYVRIIVKPMNFICKPNK